MLPLSSSTIWVDKKEYALKSYFPCLRGVFKHVKHLMHDQNQDHDWHCLVQDEFSLHLVDMNKCQS